MLWRALSMLEGGEMSDRLENEFDVLVEILRAVHDLAKKINEIADKLPEGK